MAIPMNKPHANIADWKIVTIFTGEKAMIGKISGHPNQREFHHSYQVTSAIVNQNLAEGWVETRNTVYKLGAPAKDADQ